MSLGGDPTQPTVPIRRHTPPSLRLTRPSPAVLAELVARQADAPFSYDQVGATRGGVPDGWSSADRERVIGHGEHTWQRARAALESWTQFDLGWVHPHSRDVPIAEGAVFAFSTQQLGVWTVNACRIVYVVDESDDDRTQFGFAYGTLDGHMVRGEERFLLTWDHTTDEVRFRVHQFSQLAHPLIKVIAPVTRRIQARFNRQAVARLAAEVAP